MILTITVAATQAADQLRSLDRELADVDELRGRVRPVAGRPKAGELGVLDSALTVALGQGGAVTVLATAIITWLRRRVGTVSVQVTGGGRTLELTAENVRGLTPDQVGALVDRLGDALAADSSTKTDSSGQADSGVDEGR